MAKTADPRLIEQLREESEKTRNDPIPEDARFKRPNREQSRVYSVRLSEQEYAELQLVADAAHLPAATLVRSWILARLEEKLPES